ncbi:MAG TPA: extracellular solute-binding protein [Myxococcota bacterium]|nr:extracellular solute-binding protein [Myxococcota bacterium]HON24503.1 extracellular solute-binding protein [Myxococcota bacterium]HOS61047.1 extracellular solute-binding protein [Myxococcota bacterium]HPC91356.1 extracellular solute-binding protein [Myxococcota bacterium]HPL24995.1 extracellular solute-binding protein [Myxococcota bacterium]
MKPKPVTKIKAIPWLLAFVALLLVAVPASSDAQVPIKLWHSYRGAEREALDRLAQEFTKQNPNWPVEPLAVPYDAFANKLTSAIPRGHGPDVFIAAHERLGDWVLAGLLAPLPADETFDAFFDTTVEALTWDETKYGYPLAFKSLALFVRDDLLKGNAPKTTDELIQTCERLAKEGLQGKSTNPCIAWEAGSFYHHGPWLFGFGGGVFDSDGNPVLNRPENQDSLQFISDLTNKGFLPQEPTSALVTQLFEEGHTPMAINGPWFIGELSPDLPYSVHPIPSVSKTGLPSTPFLTVEGALVSSKSNNMEGAIKLARFLAVEGAAPRLSVAKQAVAYKQAFETAEAIDPIVKQFAAMVESTVPMPNVPVMRAVWEPGSRALRAVLRGATTPEAALKSADQQISIATRPAPSAANPMPLLLGLAVLAIGALIWAAKRMRSGDVWMQMKSAKHAYLFLAPAAVATAVLVFVPFTVGTAVALFSHHQGTFTYVGFANFINILGSTDYSITDPLSFWFTLAVTIMWTVVNVFLHVTIGVALALVLRHPWMKLRGIYRALLIVPWAVPNYITALIWKGMFHKQFGAINGLLAAIGLEPVSWFSHFWTSFAANVTTNTWLGFPFMMVITLGALQSIPAELEEAAEVDGASPVQRFFAVTLPMLKPALLPAVILGGVWTFNMFNIIFLVSGGEPDGATEILISEAYRWAFTRQEQYGYAAAYATLIFLFLLAWSMASSRIQRRSA